ncbi:MAG: hypothetical protein JXC31_02560 [Acholeplasmataceae bacterium]|nr:hypothetical protein [Acholeplasmataceae bacterium]
MSLTRELLENNREVTLNVYGTSMRPFFQHRKTIVTLVNPIEPLQQYDVVLYYSQNKYILHRILQIKENDLIICGDANTQFEYVNKLFVFGVVKSFQTDKIKTDSHDKKYLKKVRLWALLRPLRPFLLRIYDTYLKD